MANSVRLVVDNDRLNLLTVYTILLEVVLPAVVKCDTGKEKKVMSFVWFSHYFSFSSLIF